MLRPTPGDPWGVEQQVGGRAEKQHTKNISPSDQVR